jgi:hypothetical protein
VIPDPNIPLEQQPSPQSAPLPPGVGFDVELPPFWKPSLGEALRHLGWRKLYFLPALLLIAFIISCFIWPFLLRFTIQLNFKWIAILLAIPFVLTFHGLRLAIRSRTDPFCIHCGHCLLGLPAVHICPECGRPYDLAMVDEYRRDPQWFIQRWRERRQLPSPGVSIAALPSSRKKSRDGT